MVGYVQCALMKNVTCIRYICSGMQLIVQVVLLCALMKNDSRTQYICSRMQLTKSSFSMCVDEKCCTYWIHIPTKYMSSFWIRTFNIISKHLTFNIK